MITKPKFVIIFSLVLFGGVFFTNHKAQAFNLSRFDSQTVPSTMTAGQSYSVTLRFTNTGTDTWTCCNPAVPPNNINTVDGYKLGNNYPADFTSVLRVAVPASTTTTQQAVFTFNVTAPTTPGVYDFQWRLVQEYTEWFGDYSDHVSITVTAAPPTVVTQDATAQTLTSATLNSQINPNSQATTVWYRYSTTQPISCNDSFGTRSPAVGGLAAGNGSTNVSVPQGISGLTQGTVYYFCAIASNATGTSFGGVLVFSTLWPSPTCTGVTPDGDWTIANSGTRTTTATGVTNTTLLLYPTWSQTGGQDDIVWYSGTNQGGGTWSTNINLASHPGVGDIHVHVYMYNPTNSTVWCDAASFVRLGSGTIQVNSNVSTSWTITCPLTNPNCTQINSGANQTTGSYPSQPFSTWTITPANLPGYDWQVSGCALNTPCSQVLQ